MIGLNYSQGTSSLFLADADLYYIGVKSRSTSNYGHDSINVFVQMAASKRIRALSNVAFHTVTDANCGCVLFVSVSKSHCVLDI